MHVIDKEFLKADAGSLCLLRLNPHYFSIELQRVAAAIDLPDRFDETPQRAERFSKLMFSLSTQVDRLYRLRGQASLELLSNLRDIIHQDVFFAIMEDNEAERFMPVLKTPFDKYTDQEFIAVRDMLTAGYLEPVPVIGMMAVYRQTNGFHNLMPGKGKPPLRLLINECPVRRALAYGCNKPQS
jgi:hypothetical protein